MEQRVEPSLSIAVDEKVPLIGRAKCKIGGRFFGQVGQPVKYQVHTPHVFNTGVTRRGILLVRFAIRDFSWLSPTSLITRLHKGACFTVAFIFWCTGGWKIWQISGTPLDLHDPRVWAIAEAECQLLEAEYEDYNSANASGALISVTLFLLRAVGFLSHQHFAAVQAKRGGAGSCSIDSNTICSRVVTDFTVYHSISCTSYNSGACLSGSCLNDKRIMLNLLIRI